MAAAVILIVPVCESVVSVAVSEPALVRVGLRLDEPETLVQDHVTAGLVAFAGAWFNLGL